MGTKKKIGYITSCTAITITIAYIICMPVFYGIFAYR